tara:strand:+ start:554 stop:823 length:270 start_codon:yes stop_codon:yes gene_type:complete
MHKDDYMNKLEYIVDDITSAISTIEHSMMEMETHICDIDEALGHEFDTGSAECMAKEPRLLSLLVNVKNALSELGIEIPVNLAIPKDGA